MSTFVLAFVNIKETKRVEVYEHIWQYTQQFRNNFFSPQNFSKNCCEILTRTLATNFEKFSHVRTDTRTDTDTDTDTRTRTHTRTHIHTHAHTKHTSICTEAHIHKHIHTRTDLNESRDIAKKVNENLDSVLQAFATVSDERKEVD